jgi:hypothetical protein
MTIVPNLRMAVVHICADEVEAAQTFNSASILRTTFFDAGKSFLSTKNTKQGKQAFRRKAKAREFTKK